MSCQTVIRDQVGGDTGDLNLILLLMLRGWEFEIGGNGMEFKLPKGSIVMVSIACG